MVPHATAFLVPLLQIVWIDVLLSGDNAVVIALACRSLPLRQRRLAIWLGATAAIALRVIFTLSVAQVLALRFVKIISGAILIVIAIRLVEEEDFGETDRAPPINLGLGADYRRRGRCDVARQCRCHRRRGERDQLS